MLLAGSAMAFLSSCYSYKEISGLTEFDNYKARRSVYVLKATTKNDSVFFSEKMPAKMLDDKITGFHQLPLASLKADSVIFKQVKYKRIVDYVYKDGIRYEVFEDKDQVYVFTKSIPVNIPYSDLNSVYLKTFQPGRTAILVGGSSAGFAGILILLLLNMTFDLGYGGV